MEFPTAEVISYMARPAVESRRAHLLPKMCPAFLGPGYITMFYEVPCGVLTCVNHPIKHTNITMEKMVVSSSSWGYPHGLETSIDEK